MSKHKIVVTNWVHPEILDYLRAHAITVANESRVPWRRAEILAQARDAAGLVAFMPDSVDEAFLAACPRLRVIACALKGWDNFDVAACTRRGVRVTVVPDLLTAPTAELTVGLMIALARNIPAGDRHIRSGAFDGWRPILYGTGLAGSTVGLVGLGAVGRAVARRLAPFEARLLYHDGTPLAPAEERALGLDRAPFDRIVETADFVVLGLPLTAATKHLVGRDTLARMKPGAFLVNTARGSVVDEEAVADALETGRLAGYAADVFEMEDWARPDRPTAIALRLLANPRATLLTPHLGSAVDAVRRDIAMAAARSAVAVLRGETPEGAVNRFG